jgi:uncharacterized protein (TIGR03083 family)
MDTSEYLDAVLDNAALFVEAARRTELDAPVPTCPKWTVAGLAEHQGRIFRWVSALVETGSQTFIHPDTLEKLDEDEDPITWLEEGAEQLLAVLGDADPDAKVWNWFDGAPAPARFWHRRMAHEVVVHRADAEAAAGRESQVEPVELAADGIDEFLHFLPARTKNQDLRPLAGSYHFHTTDVPGEWVVVFTSWGVTIRREHAKADVAVRGPASDLELFLYSRRGPDGLEVFGNEAQMAAWTEHIHF